MHIKKQKVRFKKALSLLIAITFAISSVAQATPYTAPSTNYLRPAAVVNTKISHEIESGLELLPFDVNTAENNSTFLSNLNDFFDKKKGKPFKKNRRDGIYIAEYQTRVFYSLLQHIAERYTEASEGIAVLVWGGASRFQQAIRSDADVMLLYDSDKINKDDFLIFKENFIAAIHAAGYGKVDMFAWHEIDEAVKHGRICCLDMSALIGCRLIWGDKQLFEKFVKNIKPLSVDESLLHFIWLRFLRKLKSAMYPKKENPNIKYSKGSLLDIFFISEFLIYMDELTRERDFVSSLELLRSKNYIAAEEQKQLLEAFSFFEAVRNTMQFLTRNSTNDLTDELSGKTAAFFDFRNREVLIDEFWRHAGNVSRVTERFEKEIFARFTRIKGESWLTRLRKIESDIASFSQEEIMSMIKEGDIATITFIAFYSQNSEILRIIGDSKYNYDWTIRASLSNNRLSPPDVLSRLAKLKGMEWRDIRLWVARNPSSPSEALKHIIDYELSRGIEIDSARKTLAMQQRLAEVTDYENVLYSLFKKVIIRRSPADIDLLSLLKFSLQVLPDENISPELKATTEQLLRLAMNKLQAKGNLWNFANTFLEKALERIFADIKKADIHFHIMTGQPRVVLQLFWKYPEARRRLLMFLLKPIPDEKEGFERPPALSLIKLQNKLFGLLKDYTDKEKAISGMEKSDVDRLFRTLIGGPAENNIKKAEKILERMDQVHYDREKLEDEFSQLFESQEDYKRATERLRKYMLFTRPANRRSFGPEWGPWSQGGDMSKNLHAIDGDRDDAKARILLFRETLVDKYLHDGVIYIEAIKVLNHLNEDNNFQATKYRIKTLLEAVAQAEEATDGNLQVRINLGFHRRPEKIINDKVIEKIEKDKRNLREVKAALRKNLGPGERAGFDEFCKRIELVHERNKAKKLILMSFYERKTLIKQLSYILEYISTLTEQNPSYSNKIVAVSVMTSARQTNIHSYWVFEPMLKLAREKGLHVTVHEGETWQPGNIQEALEHIKGFIETGAVERFDHATALGVDPDLIPDYSSKEKRDKIRQTQWEIMELLKEKNIALGTAPSSNLALSPEGIESMPQHPARRFYQAMPDLITINDDVVGDLADGVSNEFAKVWLAHPDFNYGDFMHIIANGFKSAFWTDRINVSDASTNKASSVARHRPHSLQDKFPQFLLGLATEGKAREIAERTKVVVFDIDGTLIEGKQDITKFPAFNPLCNLLKTGMPVYAITSNALENAMQHLINYLDPVLRQGLRVYSTYGVRITDFSKDGQILDRLDLVSKDYLIPTEAGMVIRRVAKGLKKELQREINQGKIDRNNKLRMCFPHYYERRYWDGDKLVDEKKPAYIDKGLHVRADKFPDPSKRPTKFDYIDIIIGGIPSAVYSKNRKDDLRGEFIKQLKERLVEKGLSSALDEIDIVPMYKSSIIICGKGANKAVSMKNILKHGKYRPWEVTYIGDEFHKDGADNYLLETGVNCIAVDRDQARVDSRAVKGGSGPDATAWWINLLVQTKNAKERKPSLDAVESLNKVIKFHARRDELPKKADLLMLLGSDDLRVPLEAAMLYKQGLVKKILVSGACWSQLKGVIPREAREAYIYRDILIREGVPKGAIIIEDESTSTEENIINSKKLLEAKGIPHDKVILMQFPIGQRIAGEIFKKHLGFGAYNYAPYIPETGVMSDKDFLGISKTAFIYLRMLSILPARGEIGAVDIPADIVKAKGQLSEGIVDLMTKIAVSEGEDPSLAKARAIIWKKLVEQGDWYRDRLATPDDIQKAAGILEKGGDFIVTINQYKEGLIIERIKKIILVTDIGWDPDDALALAMILNLPAVKLLGIITTDDKKKSARVRHEKAIVARKILQLCKSEDIPIYSEETIRRSILKWQDAIRGTDRFRNITKLLMEDELDIDPKDLGINVEGASTSVVESLKENPDAIIICIGGLGPISKIIDEYEKQGKDTESLTIFIMGGYGVNKPFRFSYNLRVDEEASQKVLKSKAKIFLVSSRVTETDGLRFYPDSWSDFPNNINYHLIGFLRRAVAGWISYIDEFKKARGEPTGFTFMHDPLTVYTAVINPDIVKWQRQQYKEDKPHLLNNESGNIMFASSISLGDARRFMQDMKDVIKSFSAGEESKLPAEAIELTESLKDKTPQQRLVIARQIRATYDIHAREAVAVLAEKIIPRRLLKSHTVPEQNELLQLYITMGAKDAVDRLLRDFAEDSYFSTVGNPYDDVEYHLRNLNNFNDIFKGVNDTEAVEKGRRFYIELLSHVVRDCIFIGPDKMAIFSIFKRRRKEFFDFESYPSRWTDEGPAVGHGIYWPWPRDYNGEEMLLRRKDVSGEIRGTVTQRIDAPEGFLRLDPPENREVFLRKVLGKSQLSESEKSRFEDEWLFHLIAVIQLFHKFVNPSKELILLDSAKQMLVRHGIVLPDRLTIGNFVKAVEAAKPKVTKPRKARQKSAKLQKDISKSIKEILTKTHAKYPVTITNRLGLHVRVASIIEGLAKNSKSRATITKGRRKADASSLEQLAKLAAEEGDTVVIEAKGEDAMDVATKIEEALKDESILGNIGSGIKSSSAGDERINSLIADLCGGDKAWKARDPIIEIIQTTGNLEIAERILKLLDPLMISSSRSTRVAIDILGRAKYYPAIPTLLNILNDKSKNYILRAEAAEALGNIRSNKNRIIETLIKIAKDKNEDDHLRGKSALALAKIGDESLLGFFLTGLDIRKWFFDDAILRYLNELIQHRCLIDVFENMYLRPLYSEYQDCSDGVDLVPIIRKLLILYDNCLGLRQLIKKNLPFFHKVASSQVVEYTDWTMTDLDNDVSLFLASMKGAECQWFISIWETGGSTDLTHPETCTMEDTQDAISSAIVHNSVKGTIVKPLFDKSGYLRIDTLVECDDPIAVITNFILFLVSSNGVNLDKELILFDSIKDMFARQGIVLPDKLTIGGFVEAVKTAKSKTAIQRKPARRPTRRRKAKTTPSKQILTKTHARYPVTITNRLGLHVRVASIVEGLAKNSKSKVTITKGRKKADASSLEQLAKLAAEEGDTVVIEAIGEDAMDVANKIEEALKDESILGNIGSGTKSSSAGEDFDIATITSELEKSNVTFTRTDASMLHMSMLTQTMDAYQKVIGKLKVLKAESVEKAVSVAEPLKRAEASLGIMTLSKDIAAESANIKDITGTIIINDAEIPANQKILLTLLDKESDYLKALEEKLGCKIRLLSQFNPDTDRLANMIAISRTKIDTIPNLRYINIDTVIEDAYIPLEQIIVFAKGLLAYNRDTRQDLDSILAQMYRLLAKRPIQPQLLDKFLNESIFVLALPAPVPVDERYYEDLHKQAMAALIAA